MSVRNGIMFLLLGSRLKRSIAIINRRKFAKSDERSRPSGGADWFPAIHLVEYSAALRALDDVRCQTHQLVRLNLVTAERAGKREDEAGLSFKPRRHHPTRPSAERTGFRIMRYESRPRNTSDGRYCLCS
jgi:hypothetical protein